MKRKYLCTSLLALFCNIQNAQAEQRLFPTDILEKGEADVELLVDRDHHSNSFLTASGRSGVQKYDRTSESIGFRYGLGESWHVGLALSNNSTYELHTNYDNGPSFLSTQYQGRQNPSLWVKYGFVSDRNSPFSLSGALRVRPNTTGEDTGSEIARLVGGWDFGNGLKGYAGYAGEFPHDHKLSRVHSASVGAFKAITDNFILTPYIRYSRFEANDLQTATQGYGVGLSALVQIGHNSYVRPGVSVYQYMSRDRKDGTFHWGEAHGKDLSVSFYHLF